MLLEAAVEPGGDWYPSPYKTVRIHVPLPDGDTHEERIGTIYSRSCSGNHTDLSGKKWGWACNDCMHLGQESNSFRAAVRRGNGKDPEALADLNTNTRYLGAGAARKRAKGNAAQLYASSTQLHNARRTIARRDRKEVVLAMLRDGDLGALLKEIEKANDFDTSDERAELYAFIRSLLESKRRMDEGTARQGMRWPKKAKLIFAAMENQGGAAAVRIFRANVAAPSRSSLKRSKREHTAVLHIGKGMFLLVPLIARQCHNKAHELSIYIYSIICY